MLKMFLFHTQNLLIKYGGLDKMAKENIPQELTELLIQLNNKLDAMNSYYAKTITVVNDQLDLIKSTNDKIKDIWISTCTEDVEKAIELHNKQILKKKPVKKRAIKKK